MTSPRIDQTLRRYPRLRYLNEVEYPGWALNRRVPSASGPTPLSPARKASLAKQGSLLNWYIGDRDRATECKSALRDLSQETEEDERGFLERILDKIDEWLE